MVLNRSMKDERFNFVGKLSSLGKLKRKETTLEREAELCDLSIFQIFHLLSSFCSLVFKLGDEVSVSHMLTLSKQWSLEKSLIDYKNMSFMGLYHSCHLLEPKKLKFQIIFLHFNRWNFGSLCWDECHECDWSHHLDLSTSL